MEVRYSMRSNVYFTNNSWAYVKKEVNMFNFTISFTEERGFQSKESAEKEWKENNEQYDLDLCRLKKIANMQYTFKEYVEYWLSHIFLENTDKSTKVIGVWAVQHLIIPNIEKDIILSYVSADFINDIIKKCIPICSSAGETVLKYLHNILKSAYIYGYIPNDIRDRLIHVKRHKRKIQLLTKCQLKLLLTEAQKHPGCYFEILLGLFVGLRTGEIRGLQYDDFDPQSRTIHISRQCTTNYSLIESNGTYVYSSYMDCKEPKCNSSRIIRVPNFIFRELEIKKAFNQTIIQNRRKKGFYNLDENYISISPYGTVKKKGTLLSSLKRMCNFAGVPQISFHTLRDQFATMLLELGLPLEDISNLLGHKSVLTTFNYYCGIMDADDAVRDSLQDLIPVKKVSL